MVVVVVVVVIGSGANYRSGHGSGGDYVFRGVVVGDGGNHDRANIKQFVPLSHASTERNRNLKCCGMGGMRQESCI